MKHIPNIVTCLNLFSGCLSCVLSLKYGNYQGAFLFIALAALFDFIDGFTARILKAYSPIGGQLDSLADVISFGVAPGFVVFSFLTTATENFSGGNSIPYLAFLIPIFSAIRLAKFNIDTRQTSSFLGLPVPANGLFWGALIPSILPCLESNEALFSGIVTGLVIVFCLLMVSELPMFSLKFKHYNWPGNQWAYSLIVLTIVLTALFQLFGICLSIISYILLSLTKYWVYSKKKI
jgi:CDP-diacylglycerol--serine O-phosphatidyltransferase